MDWDAIDRLLEAAEQTKGDEPALMRIIDELERRSLEENISGMQYATAYAWYLHPRRMAEKPIQRRVEELLQQVLRDKPNDYLSLLYIGHNKYDCGDYLGAKQYFERAKKFAPEEYIGLKAYEMIACSAVMEVGVGEALEELEAFVRETSDPLYELPDIWPRELVKAFKRRGKDEISAEKIAKAVELVDRLDQLGELNGWLGETVRRIYLPEPEATLKPES